MPEEGETPLAANPSGETSGSVQSTRTLYTIVNRALGGSKINYSAAQGGAELLGEQHLAIVDDADRLAFQAIAIERRVFRFRT